MWCAWRVDSIPASSTTMSVLGPISTCSFAASFSSLSTQYARASQSSPSATAVRHATAVGTIS